MKKVRWTRKTATGTNRYFNWTQNVRRGITLLRKMDVVEKLYVTTADANSANTAEG